MAKVEVIFETIKQGNGDQETAAGLENVEGAGTGAVGSMTEFNAVLEMGTKALETAKMAYDAIIVKTVEYAASVDELAQISGQSAESTSRLLALAQQYGVSTEALTLANKTLANEGMTLSIDTMKKLSEEYRGMGNDAERAQFLTDNFGRSGYQLVDIMELGSAAIQAQTNAINENMIMTEQNIAQAKQFSILQEQNKQIFDGLSMKIGMDVIPTLSDLELVVARNAEKGLDWKRVLMDSFGPLGAIPSFLQDMSAAHQDNAAALEANSTAAENNGQSQADMAAAMAAAEQSAKDQTEALRTLTQVNQGMIQMVGSFQAAEDSYTKASQSNTQQRVALEQERAQKIAQGYWESGTVIQDLDAKLAANAQKAADNAAAHDLATKKILFGYLEQQLAVGGLTKGETEALLEQGKQWGIFSDTSIKSMRAAMATAGDLAAKIDNMPSEKSIHVAMTVEEIFNSNRVAATMGHKAAGGPVAAGETYLVGEAGPEILTMGGNGFITPNQQIGGGGNIALSVNVSGGGIIADPQEVGRQMVPALRYALRQLGMAA